VIGTPLKGLGCAIVDESLAQVADGATGELCLQGPQVTAGYWKDANQTQAKFVAMPWYDGPDNRWYKTGDLASQRADGQLVFLGRADEQVKIRGYRVELLEIEHVLKDCAQTSAAAVVAFPRNEFGPIGTTAFVVGAQTSCDSILDLMKARLADYMVPQRVIELPELPLNANGKIDKKALLAMLEAGGADPK
jgi:acyl-coenzyme A synthetase/AMP-(fatty) acid ligase